MRNEAPPPPEDLPPPIRGGAADRQSAQQRQAPMSAPMVYITSGGAASLRRAIGAVEHLPADASADDVVEAIRSEDPELADRIGPVIRRLPFGWTSHQWAVVILMLCNLLVNVFGSPEGAIREGIAITAEQVERAGHAVIEIVGDSQTDPEDPARLERVGNSCVDNRAHCK